MKLTIPGLVGALLITYCFPGAASAAIYTLTISPQLIVTGSADAIEYDGTFTNLTTSSVSISGDAVMTGTINPYIIDDTVAFGDNPSNIGPGQSVTFDLFSFDFTGAPVSTYTGLLSADVTANQITVDASNLPTTIQVISPVSAAPEPSTWALLMLGLGSIGLMLRRVKQTTGLDVRADAIA